MCRRAVTSHVGDWRDAVDIAYTVQVNVSVSVCVCVCVMGGVCELERWMREDLFKLTVPPPADDCFTANGYLKKKCRYDKQLADLYKVYLYALCPAQLY